MAKKKLLPRLALALLATLLSLGAAEAGLRLYFGTGIENEEDLRQRLEASRKAGLGEGISLFGLVEASDHQDIVYQLKPDLEGTFRGQPIHTNSAGFRGRDYPIPKAPGTVRIVGLGDSHMFGWGVGQEAVYLHRLEEALNAAGSMRYEVLNFGAPGYNTTMEAATLEHRALAYDPDWVVIHFVGNDFGLPHFLQPPRGDGVDPRHWYLVSLLKALLGPPPQDTDMDLLPHDRSHHEDEFRRETNSRYQYMLGPDGYRQAMDRIARLTRERDIPVVILVLGASNESRALMREAAQKYGFPILDAAPSFGEYMRREGIETTREVWRNLFQIPNDGHPSALAHRLYAEVLADYFQPQPKPVARLGAGSTQRRVKAFPMAKHPIPNLAPL